MIYTTLATLTSTSVVLTTTGIITDLSALCMHDMISFTNFCIFANKLLAFFVCCSMSMLSLVIVSLMRFSSSETILVIFSTDSTTDSTKLVVSSTIILLVSSTNLAVSSTTLTASSMIGLAVSSTSLVVSSTTYAASSTTTSLFPTRVVAISSINLDVSSMTT